MRDEAFELFQADVCALPDAHLQWSFSLLPAPGPHAQVAIFRFKEENRRVPE